MHLERQAIVRKLQILLLLTTLVFVFGAQVACSAGLPRDEEEEWYTMGYSEGVSQGRVAEIVNANVFLVEPGRTEDFQMDFYIPKGYLSVETLADAHFTNGPPYNEKQKKQACEAYNWGFYAGFYYGAGLSSP